MSTSKQFDKICGVVLVLTILLTVVFCNAEALGVQKLALTMGYESRLFDTSVVHTIDIVMDDWDTFIDTCENEAYAACSVVIDKEAYKNVAIRAKGNTSLSSVAAYGNDRYSFKIEFDHYDNGKNYYGLDKLSLNNIIQDNTYMKDYLCYQMMGCMGVDAPLCSYVWITVNGEAWGLYLAVEGVEDGFLQRNYGNADGALYKPDSQSMGGGRGNGADVSQTELAEKFFGDEMATTGDAQKDNRPQEFDGDGMEKPEDMPQGFGGDGMEKPEDMPQGFDGDGMEKPEDMPQGFDRDEMEKPENMPQGFDRDEMEKPEDMPQGFDRDEMEKPEDMPQGFDGDEMEKPEDMSQGMNMERPDGMGSEDVSLIYTDDEYSSYSNIFENAKTDITDADKDRLIASLKSLNENTDIEKVVDVEEVIRYFVVHNFVCNFDSYTGGMIHNYYLYEEEGQLSMIPWDYNLAFGGFSAGNGENSATQMVNYPIDTPVSGGSVSSRPMLSWMFEDESYTELYHAYFDTFLSECFESGWFDAQIEQTEALIADYVEQDPTKFCTDEEFETGVETLATFCRLRAESIRGQLDGTIASTSAGQQLDDAGLVDASSISLTDMGSMGNVGGSRTKNRTEKLEKE